MFAPVQILDGTSVRLTPLSMDHAEGLCEAIRDGELWKLAVTLVPHPDAVRGFIETALEAHEKGEGLTFATVDKQTGRVVGSTRYLHANIRYKRIEIGNTFLGASWQRTRLNTEAKFLMLAHAFERLGMNRVEFLTDFLNLPSRNAILRLGAKEEGVLRNHMVMPNGRIRDSVLFSIIKNEWPGVKQHLEWKLT
jgi:RimJ/RimL family protein N-acetyltransferase